MVSIQEARNDTIIEHREEPHLQFFSTKELLHVYAYIYVYIWLCIYVSYVYHISRF